ncbi:fimbrial subunit type 1 [Leminorella grimontii]|uniref:Fimbrial subunit type 1 n=1 Tax=Leminorella grimontii TaxID=82981 RepID=A0AAV5N3C6_9GAMM|nr:fimbrial protein [Leminorella grimontii]KFC96867.1 SfmA family fimbriae-like adhesin [Leminorella grimontii ATCC 33999 = DSM 5078]GKX56013.1 fimbrial subunit type 1 [Leminorella grimontii]GKX59062.1 fimbrial subunit type 1 [Leminorella grimontii]VFS57692.1 Fimbria A protein precursor [Leminorella grimontii]
MDKKVLLGIAIAAGSLCSAVQASDGTINFTGSITDKTCTIDSGSKSLNVPLGNVSKASLHGASGMKSSPTSFQIGLSGCPETAKAATVKFDGKATGSDQSLLALNGVDGVATGVGIEISDVNNNPIALYTASPEFTLVQGANTLKFVARYVSTGPVVTTGPADGTSQFTIVYK